MTRKLVKPVVDKIPADLLTPLAVYLKLSAASERSFLLESVEGGKSLARYSFIGADPERIVSGGKEAFDEVRERFATHFADSDNDLPAFIGGAIGYVGFDASEWFEPSLSQGDDAGECSFMFYRTIVAFDHAKQVIQIISLDVGDSDDAAERNAVVRRCLEDPSVPIPANNNSLPQAAETESNWTRADFEAAVVEIKELINAGECYQAVLSQCFTRQTSANAVAVYRALRSLNPSPYMFLLDLGDKQIVGASPEMLVRATGDKLEYRPIAGTRQSWHGRSGDGGTA